ncbi:hypothetical protein TSTA_002970 [Talaromyces stipitatus ATCC 10500]|uniref:N-acetyltransferase domain-containing protein n=1 Tax=Talaromyces stipitatus (strain ATCC 10500 / CBS 375.48 / QM 6759 / NRRL 1006) TaxID=441959 RepID=B8MSA1_TALSN|nr:uncharacterized protein TSTA_002970 [Talaromyces stipitatus ATCC 10500]EED12234.1 hypothetical protein TSTA_002970 [Talaromyces stipitatus ATCC 10500]
MSDTSSLSTPSRSSIITFHEVTEDNWRAVANLKMKDGQIGNLAPNVWSLCEAAYSEDAWVRAIYADETLVGMLMMAIWDPDEAYYICVEFAIAHIQQHNPKAKQLGVMSTPPEGKTALNPLKTVKHEDSPYRFYEKLGFRAVAPPDEDNEIMMVIDL